MFWKYAHYDRKENPGFTSNDGSSEIEDCSVHIAEGLIPGSQIFYLSLWQKQVEEESMNVWFI